MKIPKCANQKCRFYSSGALVACKVPLLPLNKQCREYEPDKTDTMFKGPDVESFLRNLFGGNQP